MPALRIDDPTFEYLRSLNDLMLGDFKFHIPEMDELDYPAGTRVLVLSPHEDDEVLGCGGALAILAQKGAVTKVVYMTDGRFGSFDKSPEQVIEERQSEALAGLQVLGVQEADFLGNQDLNLRCDDKTVNALLSEITRFNPSLIFLPFFNDNHPDHVATSLIGAAALERYPRPVMIYCYEVWTALYPNVLINISDMIWKKMDALSQHSSQLKSIDYRPKIRGLNSYRSMIFGRGVEYCEAFYRCDKKELLQIAEEERKEALVK
jgi:LmbE family N-acetylglucosaminyl deacetylase